jgi:hypothetical protein
MNSCSPIPARTHPHPRANSSPSPHELIPIDDEDEDESAEDKRKREEDHLSEIQSSAESMAIEELRKENIKLKTEMYRREKALKEERKAKAKAEAKAEKEPKQLPLHNKIVTDPRVVDLCGKKLYDGNPGFFETMELPYLWWLGQRVADLLKQKKSTCSMEEKVLLASYKDMVSRHPDKTRVPAGFKHIKSQKVLNAANITNDSFALETPTPKKKKKKTSPAAGAKDEETTESD